MGRQVYVYQGQEYSLPDTLSPDEALSKIKSHLGEDQPKQSMADEFVQGAKGTAAAIGDFASGMVKIPAAAMLATGGKIADPDLPLQTHWEAAQQAMEDTFPSIGKELRVDNNLGYTAPLKPFELYGEGANYIAKQASFGNKDVEGALNIAANFLPIPLAGKAKGLLKAGIEKVDPGLRNIKAKTPEVSERINNLDKIDAVGDIDTTPGAKAGEFAAPIDQEYLARRRAEEQANTTTVPKPDDLEARNINNDFLAERDAREQATQGPRMDAEEAQRRAIEEHNQAYLDEQRPRLEELADRQSYEKAQEEVNRRQADLEREVRDARTKEQVQEILARQEVERQKLQEVQNQINSAKEVERGMSRDAPGMGVTQDRAPITDSGLMGIKEEPVADPFKALVNPNVVNRTASPTGKTIPVKQGETPSKNPFGSIAGIPRKQRGGINFDEISKALGGAKNGLANVFNKLPGASEVGKMLEHVYPDVNKLKDEIRAAGVNSKVAFQKLQYGSSLVYMKTRDPLIRAVSTIMQTAAKRAEANIQSFVKPLEHSLDQLRKADPQAFIDLGEVFKREMLNRKVYKEEQLKQAGFSDEQVKLYSEMRDLYDKSYQVQNKVLEQQGRPSLSKQEYYMASRWIGDWGTNLYGKDGKLMWVIRGMSKKEVEAGIKHLKDSGIEFDESKATPTYTRKDPGKFADYPAAYAAMIQHLGETNEMSKAAREAYQSMSAEEVFKSLGQNRHFIEKANIRGFAGDRPWKDRLTDTTDMFYEQLQYNMNALEWAEMQDASKLAKEITGDETIQKQSPDSIKYAEGVIDRYTGGGDHKLFTKLENSIAEGFGTSNQDMRNIASAAKSLWIIQKMAGSMKNVLIQNPLQFINSLAWHRDLSVEGFKHNAIKTFVNAASDTLAGLSQHYGEKLGAKGVPSVSKLGQQAINYARANGILDMSVFDEHTDLRTSELQKKYQRRVGVFQVESDKLSRFAAFMGYVHHLAQSGKFADNAELFREADHYTRGSMVDTSRQERPFIVQDTGITGMLGSSLQSFNMNYLNQFAGFVGKAKQGNVTPLMAFLATSAAMSGLSGVTGFNWMGDLYDYLRDASPTAYAELPDFRKTLLDLEGDGSFYGTAMARGIPSAVTGLDVGKAFEASLPQLPVVGMVGDILKQGADVGSALSEGDLTKAAYTVMPAGLPKGAMEVNSDLFKSPYSDKYSDSKGNMERGIFRDDRMKLFKSLGLPTVAEARQKDIIYASETDKKNNAQATKYFSNQIINAWGQGKNPETAISRLAKINPEALNQLQKNQEQYIKNAVLDYKTIQADKAKNSAAARRLNEYGSE